MTTTQQPEALQLAEMLEALGWRAVDKDLRNAAAELRRLHSRVADLENITEAAKRGFSAITKRHDDWKLRALEAESQLEAIGAGGVESLRKKSMTRTVNAGALQMVINALRRDAAEGKSVRGEMADELEKVVE